MAKKFVAGIVRSIPLPGSKVRSFVGLQFGSKSSIANQIESHVLRAAKTVKTKGMTRGGLAILISRRLAVEGTNVGEKYILNLLKNRGREIGFKLPKKRSKTGPLPKKK